MSVSADSNCRHTACILCSFSNYRRIFRRNRNGNGRKCVRLHLVVCLAVETPHPHSLDKVLGCRVTYRLGSQALVCGMHDRRKDEMHRKKNEWNAENVNMIQTYLFIQAQSNELYWLVYALGHVFSMRRTILQTIYEFYRESFV